MGCIFERGAEILALRLKRTTDAFWFGWSVGVFYWGFIPGLECVFKDVPIFSRIEGGQTKAYF